MKKFALSLPIAALAFALAGCNSDKSSDMQTVPLPAGSASNSTPGVPEAAGNPNIPPAARGAIHK